MAQKRPLGPAQPRKLPNEGDQAQSAGKTKRSGKVYGAGIRDAESHGSDDYELPRDEQKAYPKRGRRPG